MKSPKKKDAGGRGGGEKQEISPHVPGLRLTICSSSETVLHLVNLKA